MKKFLIITAVLLIAAKAIFATHNRAGEITYRHISGNLFEFTLVTYTYTPSEANEYRDALEIDWGDGTSSEIPRVSEEFLPDDIQKNTYVGTHEFPGPGVYAVVMSDPNRNEGIENIPNSVNIVFTLRTVLKIDAALGYNNTPVLLNPPIDKAAVGERFVYNPSAYDPDGDSLSYRMAVCLGANGQEIPAFDLPQADNEIYVDSVTGDFVWDAPLAVGEYNVAVEVEEWRNGVKMSSIIRDMQIEVKETENRPPIIHPLDDYCLTAGENLEFTVTASDPDNDDITLSAYGGPFEFEPDSAIFNTVSGPSPLTGLFTWQTTCEHIRRLPYSALFRAEDHSDEVQLTGYGEANITVVAPAPVNLQASPTGSTVSLTWNSYTCQNGEGFKIYRRKSPYTFNPDECQTGIPEAGNYELIDSVKNIEAQSYFDDNQGYFLDQGYTYCYRIVAYFDDDAESYVSQEICVELIKDSPVFTKTSVSETDTQTGKLDIEWLKPQDFNNVQYPGPYKYVLEANDELQGGDFEQIAEISGIDNTTYNHTGTNTEIPKGYKLTLYQDNGNESIQIGESVYSSAIFLESESSDRSVKINIKDFAPWTNYEYTVYRADADENCNALSQYDSVASVNEAVYTDTGLINGKHYRYKVRSEGAYDLDYLPNPLINWSQELCAVPQDTTPPCKVNLKLASDCDYFSNTISWNMPADSCLNDLAYYRVYYKPSKTGEFELITETYANEYQHQPTETLAGCYAVSPVDSAGNYTPPDELILTCIDECYYYRLPNVFTPNKDGENDFFVPFPYDFVEKIDLKIYNRWGNLVFESQDPDINWDGTDMQTGKALSDGVYYYLCDVYEKRLSGVEVRHINGFVHIIANKNNKAD